MIAKRVMKRTNSSCISRLTGYIVGLPETRQPADWPPLIDYITDAVSDGARVDFVRVSNLPSDELRDAVIAMMHTQEMNTRSKTDKTYHLIFSFPHGEIPNREILNDIEDSLVAAIGLGDHQRISAAHDDKDHYHVHVAINKVHPLSYRNVEPFYDHNALMLTCAELEIKHNLTITKHGEIIDKTGWVQEQKSEEKTQNNLRFDSLKDWINKNAKVQLLESVTKAKTWDDLHIVANELGLEFRLRGAGLVIKATDQEVAVKASSIDRKFSLNALSDKFGEFKPSNHTLAKQIKSYAKDMKAANGAGYALYLKYQRERSAALLERATARVTIDKRRIEAAASIKAIFSKQREIIKSNRGMNAAMKRVAYSQLAIDRKRVWELHAATVKREQISIKVNHQIPNWRGFLKDEEMAGNSTATALLSELENKDKALAKNILDCTDMAKAKSFVFENLSPFIKRNGDVIYNIKDGGRVVDNDKSISVKNLTIGSALLALSLSIERFEGQALRVNGTAEFKQVIIKLAASKSLDIKFGDDDMNKSYQELRLQQKLKESVSFGQSQYPMQQQRLSPQPQLASVILSAIDEFIQSNNSEGIGNSSLEPPKLIYRKWSTNDNGKYEFAGIVSLSDRTNVALLKQCGEIIVKPVSISELLKLSKMQTGKVIALDRKGQIASIGLKR